MPVLRMRMGPRAIREVDVRDARECPLLGCFWMTTHTVRSAAGASGCSSRSTDDYVCGTREQRGCPTPWTRDTPARYRRVKGVWETIIQTVRNT